MTVPEVWIRAQGWGSNLQTDLRRSARKGGQMSTEEVRASRSVDTHVQGKNWDTIGQ